MSTTEVAAPATMKELYDRYTELATEAGIEVKSRNGFRNKRALEAAVEFLEEKPAPESKEKAKPATGEIVKLTPAQRSRLRSLSAKGKIEHPWGNRWELTKTELDKLLSSK